MTIKFFAGMIVDTVEVIIKANIGSGATVTLEKTTAGAIKNSDSIYYTVTHIQDWRFKGDTLIITV